MLSSYFRMLYIKVHSRKESERARFTIFIPLYSIRELMEETSDLLLFLSLLAPNKKLKDSDMSQLKNLRPLLIHVKDIFTYLSECGPLDIVNVESKDADVKIRIS